MKFRMTPLGITLLSLILTTLAADKADFSGVWIMDKSKAEGIPPNMDQKMKVAQNGDRLDLETDLIVDGDINTVHDGYELSGKEVEFTARLGAGQETKGKRVAKWNADGKGIEVREESTFDTPEGKVSMTMRRKWTLSADGKTLVIELNHTGPNGPVSSKRTFNKK
ncbi:MAG: hypothetical protein MOB07_21300 [Acidobacteria bacterium]|nr:hypothetical protein [Acidobacteriota bacterium]